MVIVVWLCWGDYCSEVVLGDSCSGGCVGVLLVGMMIVVGVVLGW